MCNGLPPCERAAAAAPAHGSMFAFTRRTDITERPASEPLHKSGLMRAISIACGGDEQPDKPREDRSTLPIENQSFVSSGEGVFIPAFSFPGFDSIPGVLLAKRRPKFPTALRGLLAKPPLKQDR